MTITIDIDDVVVEEVQSELALQAGRGPGSVEEWLRSILEQNIANVTAGRLQTQQVVEARAALEQAQRALVQAAAGIRAIRLAKV